MPFIHQISNVVPQYAFKQHEILKFMLANVDLDNHGAEKLKILYQRTKIETRHSVFPDFGETRATFFEKIEPGIDTRMRLFDKHAIVLAQNACEDVLAKSNWRAEEVTHLIGVSCTGMSAPGIEQKMAKALGFQQHCELFAVNFMGCYAGFHGLKLANYMLQSNPEAKVLLFCVELCTLHFSRDTQTDNLLANALFADGAAAITLSNENKGLQLKERLNVLLGSGKEDMAWEITPQRFSMKLSSYIPKLISEDLEHLKNLLKVKNIEVEKTDYFAIHPGGVKILDEVKNSFSASDSQIAASYQVMKDFGNMSSVTIFFILRRLLLEMPKSSTVLAMGFGPGLTVECFQMRKF